MASRRIASVRRACYARLYYNLLYAEKICQRLPCLGRVFCRVTIRLTAAAARRPFGGCGGPAPSGAGAGATRVRKRSRARARDRRIPVRAVRARVTSDCDLTAIGRRSCTEIGRGILKFCCQCEENFRSVHTYITNCCSRLLLLFCCYCSTLQHCFPLNVSELERSGRCSRACRPSIGYDSMEGGARDPSLSE